MTRTFLISKPVKCDILMDSRALVLFLADFGIATDEIGDRKGG